MSMSIDELIMMKDALATVALSHDEGCGCDTCAAAGGDQDALLRTIAAVVHARRGSTHQGPDQGGDA